MMYVNEYRQRLLSLLGLNLDIERASGNRLYLTDGRVVYDYLSQYGALPFGHNPGFAVGALQTYLSTQRPVFAQPFTLPECSFLASKLVRAAGARYTRCVFTNSGAETVEAAIKLARMCTRRKKVLSVRNGFHGKTYAALSATGTARFQADHLLEPSVYTLIDPEDPEALRAELMTGDYAAVIVEPVQGEGGMRALSEHFLAQVVQMASQYGTVSVFDEIQTGLGRTGYLCAAHHSDLSPDVILLSKALSAGFIPSGCMLYHDGVYTREFDRKHSSTFANNGLAATMGLAVLEELTKNNELVLRNVRSLSRYFDEKIIDIVQRHSRVLGHSGCGLMRAINFGDDNFSQNITMNYCQNGGGLAYIICGYLLHRHNIFTMPLLSQSCSLRFEPPLNVTSEDIDRFVYGIKNVCDLMEQGRYDILFAHVIGERTSKQAEQTQYTSIEGSEQAIQIPALSHSTPSGARFAFLIHTTSRQDLIRTFPAVFHHHYSKDELERLADVFMELGAVDYSPEKALEFTVSSEHAHVEGLLIFSPISPEAMMALPRREKRALMRMYLDVAMAQGASVVGLGAYTSVISHGGTDLPEYEGKLILTNGNSLTATSTVESIRSAFSEPLRDKTAVVIGARGSVGRIAALGLAHDFGRLILVGRPGTHSAVLKDIVPELFKLAHSSGEVIQSGSVLDKIRQCSVGKNMPALLDTSEIGSRLGILVESDYETALMEGDCILSATSEGKPFLRALRLKPGAVVFDTARPFDFHRGDYEQIYEGGLVRQPQNISYSDCNIVGTPRGVNLACLSETIVVALENGHCPRSLGQRIPFERATMIMRAALKHGFKPVEYIETQGDVQCLATQ